MIDVLIDVQRGDCGKGKLSKKLIELGKPPWHRYAAVAKYNGGGNAGHAIWIDDIKHTTHYLTSAIYVKRSHVLIGPGCVLNPEEFLKEYEKFDKIFNLSGRVFIHPYTHIITNEHIRIDDVDNKLGTTKKGIGPAYTDKYARIGIRAEQISELKPFMLADRNNLLDKYADILMEGSQGWWLDIDWGDYPYVTSSHIHPGFAFATFGLPLYFLRTIYGVCKPYETYVGSNETLLTCEEEDANIIREVGKEYGETTGRPRKIGYLDITKLATAINATGVNQLIVNKCDVLEETKIFKILYSVPERKILRYSSIDNMEHDIEAYLAKYCCSLKTIIFSSDKEGKDIILI